jgi:isopentenyl phosphate kinase
MKDIYSRTLFAGALGAAVACAVLALRRLRRRELSPCDLLIKLGGSAITSKATFETLNCRALDAAALAIASGQQKAVILHGAGSFGHFQAREYAVSKGTADSKFSWRGFAATRVSVTSLNHHVVEALFHHGVSAVGCSPFPRWRTRARVISNATIGDEVAELLRVGLTPVLHGDAVFDDVQGCAILSGDTIIEQLAKELRPRLVVFVTDVAGIHDRPPAEVGARLIERITVDADGQIVAAQTAGGDSMGREAPQGPLMTTAAHDVTGGIASKLGAAGRIAASGLRVVIVEAGTVHAEAALRGDLPRVCTLVVLRESDLA